METLVWTRGRAFPLSRLRKPFALSPLRLAQRRYSLSTSGKYYAVRKGWRRV